LPEISLRDVEFSYPSGVSVFRGLNLELLWGATALVGENGAGKTTLTKLLNGLLRPKAGSITVEGQDVASRSVAEMARLVGYAFQNPDDQIFERSVRDEVGFGPKAMGRSTDQVKQVTEDALQRTGLANQAEIHPHDLGLPERKWVTIASALAAEAPVLVLDEPTLGQDWPGRQRLIGLVRDLAGLGRLILVVTHDMDFVAEACPTTVVLTRGKVVYQGQTANAFDDEKLLVQAGLVAPSSTRLARALGAGTKAPVGEQAFLKWWATKRSKD